MKYLVCLVILIVLLSSCRGIKYVPVRSTVTEYKTRDITLYDSILQKDSIFMLVKGDTVYKTDIKYRYRYMTIHRRDTILKTDSILTPYPVEKQLTRWQSVKIEFGGWVFGIVIAVAIALGLRFFILTNKLK